MRASGLRHGLQAREGGDTGSLNLGLLGPEPSLAVSCSPRQPLPLAAIPTWLGRCDKGVPGLPSLRLRALG